MKKNIRYMGYLLAAPAVALLLGACSEMDDVFGNSSDKEIKFKAVETSDWNQTRSAEAPAYSVEKLATPDNSPLYLHTFVQQGIEGRQPGMAATRGTATTTENIGDQELGIFAYRHAKSQAWGTQLPNLMWNKSAVKDETDNLYHLTSNRYWPSTDEYVTFAAYAPRNGKGIVVSDDEYAGKPYIDFTVQTNATDQIDLVTAVAENQTPAVSIDNSVELQFNHALTAVKFVVGEDMFDTADGKTMTITKIAFKNIVTTGRYVIGEGWDSENMGTANTNVQQSLSYKSGEEAGSAITTDVQTFYLIPQSFTSDEQILEVTVSYNSKEYTLSKTLNGSSAWVAGQTVVYKISTSEVNKLKLSPTTFSLYTRELPTLNSGGATYTADNAYLKAEGSKVGMYIYKYNSDTESIEILEANIPLTCAGDTLYKQDEWNTYTRQKWNLPDDFEFDYRGENLYYLCYYPYKTDAEMPSLPKKGDTSNKPYYLPDQYNAHQASTLAPYQMKRMLTDVWPVENDGTEETIVKNRLYTCQYSFSISELGRLYFNSTNFSYAMGLAYGSFSTSNTVKVISEYNGAKYYLDGDPTHIWYENQTIEIVYPSTAFTDDYTPVEQNDKYYFVYRPYQGTITPTTGVDKWSFDSTRSPSGFSLSSQVYLNATEWGYIKSKRTDVEMPAGDAQKYEMQLGDIFYNDGGLSHQSNDLRSGACPIGIVVYINDGTATGDAITEKDEAGTGTGGHALVMSIGGRSEQSYDRYNGYGDWICAHSGMLTTALYSSYDMFTEANTPDKIKSDFKGYSKTRKACELENSGNSSGTYWSIFHMCDDYTYPGITTATFDGYRSDGKTLPDGATGWFVASSGQWIAALTGLGGVDASSLSFNNTIASFQTAATNFNTALSKTGLGSSIVSFNNSTGNFYWLSSSEYSASYALCFQLSSNASAVQKISYAAKNHASRTSSYTAMRYFLAF